MGSKVFIFASFFMLFIIAFVLCNISFGFISTGIRSIEQHFGISNSFSEVLECASNFGFIISVILVAYFGSVNKLRWMAGSVLVVAIGCLMVGLPGLIYKNRVPTKYNASFSVELYANVSSQDMYQSLLGINIVTNHYKLLNETNPVDKSLDLGLIKCDKPKYSGLQAHVLDNIRDLRYMVDRVTKDNIAMFITDLDPAVTCMLQRFGAGNMEICNPVGNRVRKRMLPLRCKNGEMNSAIYAIMFIGVILIGIGHSIPWVLGIPLIDEFSRPTNFTLYCGVVIILRIASPLIGAMVGEKLNSKFVALGTYTHAIPVRGKAVRLEQRDEPQRLNNSDPRWVGAWWIGFLTMGVILLVVGFVLCVITKCFHSRSPDRSSDNRSLMVRDEDFLEQPLSLFGFFRTIKSVCCAYAFVASTLARTFDALAVVGQIGFLAGYGESQFGLNRELLDRIAVPCSVTVIITGIFIGTMVMRCTGVNGRKAAVMVAVLSVMVAMFGFFNLAHGCASYEAITEDASSLSYYKYYPQFDANETCNFKCNCEGSSLQPVCDLDGYVFYNPCYAGCLAVNPVNINKLNITFEVCACANGSGVTRDFCNYSCKASYISFILFQVLSFALCGFITVPSTLFVIRSVKPADKTMALGIHILFVHIFSFIISPMAYKGLSNNACLTRGDSCSGAELGDCKAFEPARLRINLFAFFATMKFLGALLDIAVCFVSKNIDLYQDCTLNTERDLPIEVNRAWVGPDMTSGEREIDRKLRDELKLRKENGENVYIKDGRIMVKHF